MSLFIRPVISKISCNIFCSLHISYCYIPPALNICADKTSSIVNQKTLQMMSNVKGCRASRSGSFCCFDSRCELWSLQQVGVINASRGCVWISQEQKELLGRHMMGSVRREIEDRLCPSLREKNLKIWMKYPAALHYVYESVTVLSLTAVVFWNSISRVRLKGWFHKHTRVLYT